MDDMDEWNDMPSGTISLPQQNMNASLSAIPEVNMKLGTFKTIRAQKYNQKALTIPLRLRANATRRHSSLA